MKAKRSLTGAAVTELVLEIFRVNGLLLATGDRLAKRVGLTSARWQVMGALDAGPITVAQIARKMGLKRQSVQRTADLLEQEGVVVFDHNPHHRSAMVVRLTEDGQRRYARMSEIQAEWANSLGRGCGAEELKNAVAVLREMETRLQHVADDRPKSNAHSSREGDL